MRTYYLQFQDREISADIQFNRWNAHEATECSLCGMGSAEAGMLYELVLTVDSVTIDSWERATDEFLEQFRMHLEAHFPDQTEPVCDVCIDSLKELHLS